MASTSRMLRDSGVSGQVARHQEVVGPQPGAGADDVICIGQYAPGCAPPRRKHTAALQWGLVRGAFRREDTPDEELRSPASPDNVEDRGNGGPFHQYYEWATRSNPTASPERCSVRYEDLDLASGLGANEGRSASESRSGSFPYGKRWENDRSTPISFDEGEAMDQSQWTFDQSSPITSDDEPVAEEDERSEEDQEPRNASLRDNFYVRIDEEGDEDAEILAERVVAEDVKPAGIVDFMAECINQHESVEADCLRPSAHLSAVKIGDTVQLRATMSVADWQEFCRPGNNNPSGPVVINHVIGIRCNELNGESPSTSANVDKSSGPQNPATTHAKPFDLENIAGDSGGGGVQLRVT